MKILSNHNRLVDIVDLQVAYITSSNNAGHEKTISDGKRIMERRLVIFIATLLYNYSNILLLYYYYYYSNQDARDVNATTASRSDSVRGLSIRVIESVPPNIDASSCDVPASSSSSRLFLFCPRASSSSACFGHALPQN